MKLNNYFLALRIKPEPDLSTSEVWENLFGFGYLMKPIGKDYKLRSVISSNRLP